MSALAHATAAAFRAGDRSACAIVETALADIARLNPTVNAFTDVTAARALEMAAALDRARQAGASVGPLAGVPFAVKNLFDVRGLPTRAGAKINRERASATSDATLVQRLERAGAILVGALNMGEYAYDFTGENAHDGACRNPHDPTRMTGGSSSGSGAAVAAGCVPLSLGSDTNGSIRVPASLCGVFGLKPTYGRLSRGGSFPFCDSLDHVGPLARSVLDLALAYDAMQGRDARDPACCPPDAVPVVPQLETAGQSLRVGVLGGYFARGAEPAVLAAVQRAATALGAAGDVVVDGVEAGRAAAFVITNVEGARLHLDRLRQRSADFDPDTRDRFLAGALLPAGWYVRAQAVRRWWAARLQAAFAGFDLLIAPTTPVTAPKIGQKTLQLDGREVPLRPNLGLYTQPFSCVGLPVVAVPIARAAGLPVGVQLIAKPWQEARALAAAWQLEREGVAAAPLPSQL
ncbi:MAG: AtzE family amidohydrolase [Geminicoccaceae bacterium]|nr:MAG: AtzE family amidohydrolase [Geminicoccaceae bacterium]